MEGAQAVDRHAACHRDGPELRVCLVLRRAAPGERTAAQLLGQVIRKVIHALALTAATLVVVGLWTAIIVILATLVDRL